MSGLSIAVLTRLALHVPSSTQAGKHPKTMTHVTVVVTIVIMVVGRAYRWAGGSGACGKLLSGSYDGSVRLLDPATATFELLVSDEEAEYSAMDCLAAATSGSATPLL